MPDIPIELTPNARAVEGEHNADNVKITLAEEMRGYPIYIVRRRDGYGKTSDSPRLYEEDGAVLMPLTEDILRGSQLKLQLIALNEDFTEVAKSETVTIDISASLRMSGEQKQKSKDLLAEMLEVLGRVDGAVDSIEGAVNDAKKAVENAELAVRSANEAVEDANSATETANNAAEKADKAAENANSVIESTNEAAESANGASVSANAAAQRAEEAARAVEGAVTDAKKAVENAEQAVNSANEAVENANSATETANRAAQTAASAAENANAASENANTAADDANEAAEKANEAAENVKDGKSAYEVAVENGFVGTESEWLNSLRGGIEIDKTLTKYGAAADSKAVGDRFLELSNEGKKLSDNINNTINGTEENIDIENVSVSGRWNNDGKAEANSMTKRTPMLPISKGAYVFYKTNYWFGNKAILFFDSEKNLVKSVDALGGTEESYEVVTDNSIAYVAMNMLTSSTADYYLKLTNFGFNDSVKYKEYLEKQAFNESQTLRENIALKFNEGFYYSYGNKAASNSFSYSDPLEIHAGETVEYYADSVNTDPVWLTDRNGVFIKCLYKTINARGVFTYTATQQKEYLVFNKKTKSAYSLTKYVNATAIEKVNVNSLLTKNDFYKYLFSSLLCIGDSLTEGYYQDKIIRKEKSYPSYINKISGWKVENQGRSGATATSWYTTHSDIDYSLYDVVFICLGTNEGLTDTIENDTSSEDYNTYAKTHTGYYCRIIERIREQNADCKIFLFGVLGSSVNATGVTNAVIEKIAEKYDLPFCDWLNNPYFYMKGHPDGSGNIEYHPKVDSKEGTHFGNVGYLTMARTFLTLAMNYIDTHKSYFELPY